MPLPSSVANDSAITALITEITTQGKPCNLASLKRFLELFELNFTTTKIITITGTNGKGTTVALLKHLFAFNHLSFVAHTSPHIVRFNERISDGMQMISNAHLYEILQYINTQRGEYCIGYHQLSFLVSCMLAKHKQPDWLILEVGIGGRLDPANLFDADIAVITNIGLDHVELLGDTVEKIGYEKVHIARAGRPLFVGSQMPDTVIDYCDHIGATLIQCPHRAEALGDSPLAVDSYNCVVEIAEYLQRQQQLINIDCGLDQVTVQGRCQVIAHSPTIIVDVAHNADSARYLFDWLKRAQFTQGKRMIGLFSALKGKDIDAMIGFAEGVLDHLNVFSLEAVDERAYSLPTLQAFAEYFALPMTFHDNLPQAFATIYPRLSKDDILVVFGSFVTVGQFLTHYENHAHHS